MIEEKAFAKLNLSLELLDVVRNDGYHEISTVMQSVSLADTLIFERADDIVISSDKLWWRADSSLVSKAVVLMQREIATEEGVHIEVKKNIPLSSGLGGDSSDAAAVIRGLNSLWGARMSVNEMLSLAEQLGSDVPFFIQGGTQHAKGRGEILVPVETPASAKMVVVFPELKTPPHKTKMLYGLISKEDYSDGGLTNSLSWRLDAGEPLTSFALVNSFDRVAGKVFEGLDAVRRDFSNLAGRQIYLSGSGPSLFAVFDLDEPTEEIVEKLKYLRYQVWEAGCIGRKLVL